MFLSRTRFVFAALALIVMAGCQNSSPLSAPGASIGTAPPQRAVLITAGNGSTSVILPSSDPSNPVVLSTSGEAKEECPECKAAAIKYFQTGVLEPKCSRTGATRTAITSFPPPYNGHN